MLKKGLAWHYTDYDQRLELATVSNQLSLLILVPHCVRPLFSLFLKICVYHLLVGKGGSSKAGWLVGFIKPREAMGLEKGST